MSAWNNPIFVFVSVMLIMVGPMLLYIARVSRKRGGVCRMCGCTDTDCSGCIARTGEPCFWVNTERTLCSACLDDAEAMP
jgi:hypothetical protein